MRYQSTICFLFLCFLVVHGHKNLAVNSGPDKNPMKGFNSGWFGASSISTVGFQYVGWKHVEPKDNQFDWTAVENVINWDGSKGLHVVLRLFADWFWEDSTTNSGPPWLYDMGVKYLNQGNVYVTDYNNPTFIKQAVELIQAFGKQYNNDPRIYALELGLLGYWGEWHTFGFPGYAISDSAKQQILAAYRTSFPNKLLMGRYPWDPILNASAGLGFHNDYFQPFVFSSNRFDGAVESGKKWLNGPIGGEAPPELYNNNKIANFDALFVDSTGENIIKKGHYATMMVGNVCTDSSSDIVNRYCPGYMKLHKMMGYNYQLTSIDLPLLYFRLFGFKVSVNMKNIGVAPMYYNWNVEIALLDSKSGYSVVRANQINTDLRSLLPQNETTLQTYFSGLSKVACGKYQLALRISQPGASLPKPAAWGLNARNVYVEFGNSLTVLPAFWRSDNSLAGGWTILTDISIL